MNTEQKEEYKLEVVRDKTSLQEIKAFLEKFVGRRIYFEINVGFYDFYLNMPMSISSVQIRFDKVAIEGKEKLVFSQDEPELEKMFDMRDIRLFLSNRYVGVDDSVAYLYYHTKSYTITVKPF